MKEADALLAAAVARNPEDWQGRTFFQVLTKAELELMRDEYRLRVRRREDGSIRVAVHHIRPIAPWPTPRRRGGVGDG